ncbi:MAG: hypothetical protein WC238_05730, partial [Parcubacteria group bacterium]|jgi:hypothetical protein
LQDGQEVESNDETINGLIAHISSTTSGSNFNLHQITLEWRAQEDLFVAPGNIPSENQAIMPAFANLTLFMTGFTTPASEDTIITTRGNNELVIEAALADSSSGRLTTIPILSSENDVFSVIGGNSQTDRLVSTNAQTLTFNESSDGFVAASWNNDNFAETHLLRFDVTRQGTTSVVNIINRVTGQREADNARAGDIINIGQLQITIDAVNATDSTVQITLNNGGSFNKIFTKEGLTIFLPVRAGEPLGNIPASLNLTNNVNLGTDTSWNLYMAEQDRNSVIMAGKVFSIRTLVSSNNDIEVDSVNNAGQVLAGGIFGNLENNSNIRTGWIQSPLATEINANTGSQTEAKITYHGGESYGNVFIGPATGSNTPGNFQNIQIVRDLNLNQNVSNNLIVIGGPCVNTVAATLLNVNFTTCGQAFTSATNVGQDQFMIQTFSSPFSSGKVATLVAGWERGDTLAAADYLQNQLPNIQTGVKIIQSSGNTFDNTQATNSNTGNF